jgi:hypothetical protein
VRAASIFRRLAGMAKEVPSARMIKRPKDRHAPIDYLFKKRAIVLIRGVSFGRGSRFDIAREKIPTGPELQRTREPERSFGALL